MSQRLLQKQKIHPDLSHPSKNVTRIHAKAIKNQTAIGVALVYLGKVAIARQDYGQAERYCQESLAVFEGIERQHGMGLSYYALGQIAYYEGQYEAAKGLVQQSLTLFRNMGNRPFTGKCLLYLGFISSKLEDAQAKHFLREGLALAQTMALEPMMLTAVLYYAWYFFQTSQPIRAGELIGLVQRQPIQDKDVHIVLDELMSLITNKVALAKLDSAIAYGQTLDLDEVVSELLQLFPQETS